jgi:hypothetical protein
MNRAVLSSTLWAVFLTVAFVAAGIFVWLLFLPGHARRAVEQEYRWPADLLLEEVAWFDGRAKRGQDLLAILSTTPSALASRRERLTQISTVFGGQQLNQPLYAEVASG